MKLELNPSFAKALHFLEDTREHLFITGRAGTGKSTLLSYFREHTKKNVVVLAPTGVAALNVKGQTIHSFFKFKPDITLDTVKPVAKKYDPNNLYQRLDIIIIDEISMVRADLLDCVDRSLQLNRGNHEPFGGVQIVFIGDLYQLPPVVTAHERAIFQEHYASPYFFDAHVMEGLSFELIELEKVYRQKDDSFISLLNAIRNNSATEEHLATINTRHDPDFAPDLQSFSLHLTTTNALADSINEARLSQLTTIERMYEGQRGGSFETHALPTDSLLSVKIGAQVMMLNNDAGGRWVNGSIGKIIDILEDEATGDVLQVELSDGEIVDVIKHTWELFQFSYNEKHKRLESETIGTFTQYPLRLAWAVTIHKSQGKTFDQVIIDLGRGTFVHGQLYVALSRCTTLAGIVLKQKVSKRHIFMDRRVVQFITNFHYARSEKAVPLSEKIRILRDAAEEQSAVEIIYLKANDTKSQRVIRPYGVGDMEFKGKRFLGVQAYDKQSGEDRVFRIDRILSIISE